MSCDEWLEKVALVLLENLWIGLLLAAIGTYLERWQRRSAILDSLAQFRSNLLSGAATNIVGAMAAYWAVVDPLRAQGRVRESAEVEKVRKVRDELERRLAEARMLHPDLEPGIGRLLSGVHTFTDQLMNATVKPEAFQAHRGDIDRHFSIVLAAAHAAVVVEAFEGIRRSKWSVGGQ